MANVQQNMILLIGGVLVLVVGVILADVVIDAATTALTNASIGSFSGASSVGGLIPLIYFTVIIMLGVGMMGLGVKGFTVFAPFMFIFATPFPLQMLLVAILAFSAVLAYKQYRANRLARSNAL